MNALKNNKRKLKSPFMIYADFLSTAMPEGNWKENANEYYAKKILKTCCLELWF